MGASPHALFSVLQKDLSHAIDPASFARIRSGEVDWPGISFRERASSSLMSSLLKKFEGGMTSETQRKALVKFEQVNTACSNWKLEDSELYGDDYLLGEFKKLLHGFWNRNNRLPLVDHPYDILERGNVGPGAAIGSPGGDFYTKLFSSRLSTTSSSLYFWYKRYTRSFAEWSNAELTRVLTYGEPSIVEGNRLSFVPKNDDISRSICTEPVLNMYYQLGFGNILQSRLKELWGINLTTQQFKNRELASFGSRTGQFSTIDLSSASDSISLPMLRWALPPDFLRWLEFMRSPVSELPDGRRVRLNMVSTMGNGYTFPLQTVLFTAVVLSAFRLDELAPIYPRGTSTGNFAVNGDDIIVPTRVTAKVLRLLKLLGFTVNADKTFVEGPFRESCGGDYFEGRNLRGVYVKRLRDPQDLYSVINQLNQFSTRTGILLPKTVQYLLKKVRYLPVPLWESDDAGVKVPFSVAKRHVRICRDTQSILYYAWTSTPPPRIRVGDWVLYTPRGFRRREFNSSGLFLSILQGSVNSSKREDFIPLIPNEVRYRRKPRIAPNWDTPLTVTGDAFPEQEDTMTIRLLQGRFDWSRWETVAYMNLFM